MVVISTREGSQLISTIGKKTLDEILEICEWNRQVVFIAV